MRSARQRAWRMRAGSSKVLRTSLVCLRPRKFWHTRWRWLQSTPRKLIEASQSVRAEVIESCRHDLVSDLRAEEPDALTNLHFGRYLDEALIGELSVFAKKLIADGEARAYELAGRFVTLRRAERDGMPAERTHYLDPFEVLVPQDM